MRTKEQIEALQSACNTLNSYRKRKALAWTVTPADLVTLDEARADWMNGEKALAGWDDLAVFIPREVAVRLYASLTPKGRDLFVLNEVLGGWFESDDAVFDDEGKCVNGDEVDCDEDGEFCSTPSHSENVPSVEEYDDDTEHCARGALLFVYANQY